MKRYLLLLMYMVKMTSSITHTVSIEVNDWTGENNDFYTKTHHMNITAVLLPTNCSLYVLLNQYRSNLTNTSIISFLSIPKSNIVKELQENREHIFFDSLQEKDPETTSYLVKISDGQNFSMRRYRVAIFVHKYCDLKYILSLQRQLSKEKIFVHIYCLDMESVSIVDLFYVLHDVVSIKINIFISLLSFTDTLTILDVAQKFNLLSEEYTWVLTHIAKEMKHLYPSLRLLTMEGNSVIPFTVAEALHITIDINNNSLTKRENFFSNAYTKNLTLDGTEMLRKSDRYESYKKPFAIPSIKIATVLYQPLIIELPSDTFDRGICTRGLICKVSTKSNEGTKWRYTCCSGLLIDFLYLIIKDMNINYEIYTVEDGTFGGFVNGSWTGIINDVYIGRADIGLQAITILSQRGRFVDFTEPVLASNLGIIRRVKEKSSLKVVNFVFLTHLGLTLCVAIAATFFAILIVIYTFENVIRVIIEEKLHATRDVFTYVSGLLFQRDLGGKHPKWWSARFPSIAFALAMTIIMSTYTAKLTATGIVYDDNDDFKGLRDNKIVNPTTKFKFSVMRRTSFELYFYKKPKIYSFIKDYLVNNDVEALTKVITRQLDAHLADHTFLKYLTSLPQFCSQLRLYKERSVSHFSAFVVQKKSKWKDIFSIAILKLHETKQMERLMQKWIFLADCKTNENEAKSFPWRYFGGLLLWISSFVGVSVIVVLSENAYTKCKTMREKNIEVRKRNRTLTDRI